MLLDDSAVHARTCAKGGHIIRRHDRIVRWLQRWLSQGRVGSEPRVEQVLPEEHGRLDIVFQGGGTNVWVDVAVTAAVTASERAVASHAKTDGAAARAEEAVKRTRYHSRATPFVLEADGRPGPSAKQFLRRYAQEAGEGFSTSPAHAWACVSSTLQSGNAEVELAAWSSRALIDGQVTFWIP